MKLDLSNYKEKYEKLPFGRMIGPNGKISVNTFDLEHLKEIGHIIVELNYSPNKKTRWFVSQFSGANGVITREKNEHFIFVSGLKN